MVNPLASFPPWLLLFSGTALGWLKSFWSSVYSKTIGRAIQKISVKLLIEESDHEECYLWVSLFAEKYLSKKKITDLSIRRSFADEYSSTPKNALFTNYDVVPSYGSYYFWWRRRLIIFTSKKDSQSGGTGDGARATLKAKRSVSIAIYGTTKRETLFDALIEAKALFDAKNPKHLKFYCHSGDYWTSNFLPRRSMDTIYIPKTVKDELLCDVLGFLDSEDKYNSLGIPWRKGYLFYGVPGTGKSSLIQALANKLEIPIYYFNLGAITRVEDLVELMRSAEKRCIMLFEDIDAVAVSRSKKTTKDVQLINTGDLLNCIDGIIATEGRIVIMTTNHIDKLEPALIRSGRIDKRFHLDYAQEPEIKSFYDNASKYVDLPIYEEFKNMLPKPCTIADAQTILFKKDV